MNFDGLLPHQPDHARKLLAALVRYGAALDGSDTGTGKTFVALFVAKALGVVPFVVGPKNARATWESAAEKIGIEIEYINYEKVRGRRAHAGGVEVDTLRVTENSGMLFGLSVTVAGLRNGQPVYSKQFDHSDATDVVNSGLRENELPEEFLAEFKEYVFTKPFKVGQTYVAESDWIIEKKYGSGSFIEWKNRYTFVIFDEVHRCGGSKTLNSKLLIAAKRQAKFLLALSATAADDPRQMKALGFALGLHKLNGQFGFRPWLLRHGCYIDKETERLELRLNTNSQNEAFASINREIFPARGARMRKAEIPNFPKTQIIVKMLDVEKAAARVNKLHELRKQHGVLAITAGAWSEEMQALEKLMIPDVLEMVEDLVSSTPVMIFCNYTETRVALTEGLKKILGSHQVGWIDGSQIGVKGEAERNGFISRFQKNDLLALVANAAAGGESISGHDPTGKVGRSSIIFPQDSGRRLKQLVGRVDRANGADSVQYLLYLAGTEQVITAKRVEQRTSNIELLNDADLIF